MDLTDWSADGRYLSFFSTNLGGGGLFSVPLAGTGERKPIEILRSSFQLRAPRLSPDGRFVVYVSNQSGRFETYVRPFEASGAQRAEPWQISKDGGIGMPMWRGDGKELYYLGTNGAIMAADVTTTPAFKAGTPRVLFRLSEDTPVAAGTSNVSRDGDRILIAVPPPQLVQMTVFDRQGQIVGRIGQPGRFDMPMLSPDGTRVAVLRNDPDTGNRDLWTFDVATGRDADHERRRAGRMPVWSPDGKQLAYFSMRDSNASLYKKAADGTGSAEHLFRYTDGTFMGLTDWSRDSKYLTFFTGVLGRLAGRQQCEAVRAERDRVAARGIRRAPRAVFTRLALPRLPVQRSQGRHHAALRASVRRQQT